jgi:hypothetical protein
MIAFCAAEEPDFTLICRTKLTKPPDGKIVTAFRALDLDRRHRFDVLVLIIHDRDLIFCALFLARHSYLVCAVNLSDISALTAFELTCRRDQHTFAFRTKHRIVWEMIGD